MHSLKRKMLWINVVGGLAVLGSYAHGLSAHPLTRNELWGNVPDSIRPIYTLSMFFAASGYFAFSNVFFRHCDPDETRIGHRFDFGVINVLYASMLASAALWMPLTFAMIQHPGAATWIAIRTALAVTGLASLGLLGALLTLRPRPGVWAHRLAVLGSLAFSFQTAILDAVVWPAYFPF